MGSPFSQLAAAECCVERIVLNYSELKFKFRFVLALSNRQNCLGEIGKGQGILKCLVYVCQGEHELGRDKKLEEKASCLRVLFKIVKE